jgi:hypothetical protein
MTNGKGSKPRPFSIPKKVFDNNFEKIFSKGDDMASWVTCIDNGGKNLALKVGKQYKTLHDLDLARQHQIRIIDETGDDYVYPANWFKAEKNNI